MSQPKAYSVRFDGALLARGFWLYVWEIKSGFDRFLYVGRTGDSSSPNAQSPFKRIGQHLDANPNAKGNALGKQLARAGVKCDQCSFEMIAIGPVFPEQSSYAEHVPKRDQMAALERAAADFLKARGYMYWAHTHVHKHPTLRSSGKFRQRWRRSFHLWQVLSARSDAGRSDAARHATHPQRRKSCQPFWRWAR
jgi:hypothetical protein